MRANCLFVGVVRKYHFLTVCVANRLKFWSVYRSFAYINKQVSVKIVIFPSKHLLRMQLKPGRSKVVQNQFTSCAKVGIIQSTRRGPYRISCASHLYHPMATVAGRDSPGNKAAWRGVSHTHSGLNAFRKRVPKKSLIHTTRDAFRGWHTRSAVCAAQSLRENASYLAVPGVNQAVFAYTRLVAAKQ